MSCQVRKMKMMAAASCSERAPETLCGKEVANKLAHMQAERERQDQMWTTASTVGAANTDRLSKSKCEVRGAWTTDSVS